MCVESEQGKSFRVGKMQARPRSTDKESVNENLARLVTQGKRKPGMGAKSRGGCKPLLPAPAFFSTRRLLTRLVNFKNNLHNINRAILTEQHLQGHIKHTYRYISISYNNLIPESVLVK